VDPRTAARVTAPDLMKAFNEGRGQEQQQEHAEQLRKMDRCYRVAFRGAGQSEIRTYAADQLFKMLSDVGEFVAGDVGRTVSIETFGAASLPQRGQLAP
jgi:hypothetical protein